MSDDTPTQRFPETGGQLPTEPIGTSDVREDLHEEKQKSRGLLIGLIIAGLLLLIAIVVLVVFLVRGSGEPGTPGVIGTESPAPSLTPVASDPPVSTPTPDETAQDEPAPPPAPAVRIDEFTVDTGTVFCGKNGQPDEIDLFFRWATSNGERVYFGVNTNDASSAPFFDNLPLDGDSGSNFPSGYVPFQFACGNQSLKYTLTVVDGSGHKSSASVTVTDVNFNV